MTETNELLFAGGSARLVIGEWIPFGANYIDLFSRKIRPSYAPVGSTFLAEELDTSPDEPTFDIHQPPTELVIRDSERGQRITFAARLGYLDTGGSLQEEWLGVHLDVFGRVFYGTELLSVNENDRRFSLDALSPVIADLVHDSSLMMSTLLSSSQNRFIELIHRGVIDDRDKFVALLAEELVDADGVALPSGADPLEDSDRRAELAQLLGEIYGARRLGDGTLLVWGRSGALLFSPQWHRYERALTTYGYIHSLADSVDNLFQGSAVNGEHIRRIKKQIISGEVTEASVLRKDLTRLSEDITTYGLVSKLLGGAVDSLRGALEKNSDGYDDEERELFDLLELESRLDLLIHKVQDLTPTVEAVETSLEGLNNLVGTLQEEETDRLNRVMQILTVVTTVAVPITIITGWYGMNFRFMPELNWPGSYFVVIGISIAVAVGLLILFKKKKWF